MSIGGGLGCNGSCKLELGRVVGLLVVLHPTQFCNISCSYCWAPERDNPARMSLGIVEEVLKQISTRDISPLEICWLTGEPLVLGIDYYRSSIELCRRLIPEGVTRRFIIQTNGTLIDDEFAAFFAASHVAVGVSVDGPKELHDRQRADRRGRPTHDKAMRGIDLLMKHKVKGGALCVISKDTLRISPDDLFNFFHDRGIAWSYLIEAKIGENASTSRGLSREDIPELQAFFGRLLNLWGKHPEAYIRDFDQVSRRLFGFEGEYSLDNLGCLDILNVLPNGDFFWGNPELISATMHGLTNIRSNIDRANVWKFRDTAEFRNLQAETHKGIIRCKNECEFFINCRGGNPAHKYYTAGSFDATSHLTCELNDQIIAPLMLDKLRADA